MTRAELRARIIAARRAHDAAIRGLDRKWRELLAVFRARMIDCQASAMALLGSA